MTRFDDTFLSVAAPAIDFEFSQTITITLQSREPITPTAQVTKERRARRYTAGQVRIVRERTATVTAGIDSVGFDDLNESKLTTTVLIGGVTYAVENVVTDDSGVRFELIRESRKEMSRPNYRGIER